MESQQGKSMCVCVRKPNEKVGIFDIFFFCSPIFDYYSIYLEILDLENRNNNVML